MSSSVHSDMVMLQFFFSSCVTDYADDLNPFQSRCSCYLLNSTSDEDFIWVCIHFFHNIYAQNIIFVLIGYIFVKNYKYKVEEERDSFFRTRLVHLTFFGGVGGELAFVYFDLRYFTYCINIYNRFHHHFFLNKTLNFLAVFNILTLDLLI